MKVDEEVGVEILKEASEAGLIDPSILESDAPLDPKVISDVKKRLSKGILAGIVKKRQ